MIKLETGNQARSQKVGNHKSGGNYGRWLAFPYNKEEVEASQKRDKKYTITENRQEISQPFKKKNKTIKEPMSS